MRCRILFAAVSFQLHSSEPKCFVQALSHLILGTSGLMVSPLEDESHGPLMNSLIRCEDATMFVICKDVKHKTNMQESWRHTEL